MVKKLFFVLALLCGSAFALTSFSQPAGNQFGCMFGSLPNQAKFSDYVCNAVSVTGPGGLYGNVGFNIGDGFVIVLNNAQNLLVMGQGPVSGSVTTATHTIKANFAFTDTKKVNHTGSFTAKYKWMKVTSPKGTWYKPVITNLHGSYK